MPFVLPPMTGAGFQHLIASFVRHGGEPSGAPGPRATGSPDRPFGATTGTAPPPADELPSDVPEAFQVEARSQIAPSLASSGSASTPLLTPITATPVTKRELDLLGALATLVRTPRAATRMFNIYGLLRSAKDLTPEGTFLGTRDRPGDYQAVIQLLGILTARPRLLGVVLWGGPDDDPAAPRGLCRGQGPGSWRQFVASLQPVQGPPGSWSNGVTATIEAADLGAWRGLVTALDSIGDMVSLDDIERYRVWGPQVARFSFQLSAFADPD